MPVTRVGVGAMFTVVVATPVQDPMLPVTVYTVVREGLTVWFAPLKLLFQAKLVAPVALSITGAPEHTEVKLADALTGRGGPRVTLTVFTCTHVAFEPVTVT